MNAELRKFYAENKSAINLVVFAGIVALVIVAIVCYRWQVELLQPYQATVAAKIAGALVTLAGGFAALVVGGFALYRWTIDQRWRRVQYTYGLVEKFLANENTKLALRMLDVQGRLELPPVKKSGKGWRPVKIDEDLLINSLATLQQKQRFDEPEFSIRMIFDQFFTDLSMFQHHIDAGLIGIEDIQPYFVYWIKSINGHGPIYTIRLAGQINAFLRAFDYSAVLKLAEAMNHPLKTIDLCVDDKITSEELAEHCQKEGDQWVAECKREERSEAARREALPTTLKKHVWLHERRYDLCSVVDGNYFSVIRSDFVDRGGMHPDCEACAILWDDGKKALIDIEPLFDEIADDGPTMTVLAKEIIASLKAGDQARDFKQGGNINKAIEPKLSKIGAVVLAPSTEYGKSSGLKFYFSPRELGTQAKANYLAFVPWQTLEPRLSQRGQEIFSGERPESDAGQYQF